MDKQTEIEKLKKKLARLESGRPGSGGPGRGQGRKPLPIKKLQCYAYIEENKVEALGGKLATQDFMKKAVDNEITKVNQSQSKN